MTWELNFSHLHNEFILLDEMVSKNLQVSNQW